LLHGPHSEIDGQYAAIGARLVEKLTFPTPEPSVKTSDIEISPGLKVRTYTPEGYAGNKPVCVFFHGGGWSMGDLEGEDPQLRTASKDTGVVIVSVDYRLAPAHPYPAAPEDCLAAYYWAIKNSELLNTTPNEVIVFGTSAGGNLALCTALKLIDGGKADTLKGIVAVVPVTVAPEVVPEKLKGKYTSYTEHAEHTINTASGMHAFYGR
jgi:versiconal hemiacetal acetate esterase